jgi:hypothetical protein
MEHAQFSPGQGDRHARAAVRRSLTAIAVALALIAPASAAAAPPAPTVTAPAQGVLQTASPLAFSGTAGPGDLITIAEGTASVGTTAGLDGAWSASVPVTTDGTHTYAVTAADLTGPSPATPWSVVVDVVAPAAPAITSPPEGSAQRATTVTLVGTTEPGAAIAVLDGAVAAGTATADATGTWMLALTVAEGLHAYTATAKDAGGHTSPASATRNVRVDLTAPVAPVVSGPAQGVLQTSSPVTFSGTAEAGAAVTITENGALVGSATATGGAWSAAVPVTTDGTHTYAVTATDAAGNISTPAAWSLAADVVPPAPPLIDSPANGTAQRSTTVALAGSTEAGAKVAVLEGAASRGTATADGAGNWSLAIAGVAQGMHTYTATATDAGNHTSAPSAVRSVTVALNAPSPPVISGGPDAFSIVSPDAGTTLDCRLDGSAGQGAYGPCPLSYPGLAPGDYTLVARATDAAGNSSTASRPFAVGGAAQTVPAQPAVVVVSPLPAATPAFGRTVVLRPAGGRTLVRRPGAPGFEELRAKTAVPLGTAVDVKSGTVVLTAAPAAGARPESARFFGGVFTVSQASGATRLTLSEPLRCGRTRKLWGDGSGSFRIRGRYGAATGRGAKWLVQDSCSSTVVRVSRGVVAVSGDRTSRTVLVRAGRHYTVLPKR